MLRVKVQASGNLAFMEGESDFSALLDLPLEVLDLGGVLKYALVAVDASMNRNQTRLPSVGYYEPRIVGGKCAHSAHHKRSGFWPMADDG